MHSSEFNSINRCILKMFEFFIYTLLNILARVNDIFYRTSNGILKYVIAGKSYFILLYFIWFSQNISNYKNKQINRYF